MSNECPQSDINVREVEDVKVGGTWVRTKKCGCGECRFKPQDYVCPSLDSPKARWLWSHRYSSTDQSKE